MSLKDAHLAVGTPSRSQQHVSSPQTQQLDAPQVAGIVADIAHEPAAYQAYWIEYGEHFLQLSNTNDTVAGTGRPYVLHKQIGVQQ